MSVPEPITRIEKYWKAILDKIQGGGSSVTVTPLSVTENGEYTAPSGTAYSPVTVDVPPEGLVDAGPLLVTGNGTFAPDPGQGYSEVDVSVPTGLEDDGILVVTSNGTYAADPGHGWSEVEVACNVATRDVVDGTIASPFGNLSPATIRNGLRTNQMSASIYVAANPTVGTPTAMLGGISRTGANNNPTIMFSVADIKTALGDSMSVTVEYATDGTLLRANALIGGAVQDLSQAASLLITNLIVVTHPIS